MLIITAVRQFFERHSAYLHGSKRWAAFARFLDDGRICCSNAAAERAVRGIAIGRSNWTFAGSHAGGHGATVVATPIETRLALILAKQRDRDAARRMAAMELDAALVAIAEAASATAAKTIRKYLRRRPDGYD